MLPLPQFELLRPRRVEDAVRMLAEHGEDARLVAGGTDILVNMKHGLLSPRYLVDLTAVEGLRSVRQRDDGGLSIGALIKLSDLARDPAVRALYPALSDAMSQVAGPQHRNMGTLGGNICLDTRCVYFNQTHFWRQALGYCLKKDGTECHVVKGGTRCVAAQTSDSVPVLISLDARVSLVSAMGERIVPVEQLFRRDGVYHLNLEPEEILTRIDIPPPAPGLMTSYRKLRVRKSIDFPALSVAVAMVLDRAERIGKVAVVGTALMATPRRVSGLDRIAVGETLTPELVAAIGERAYKQLVPLTNILVDPEWRREMVPVLVKRAMEGLQPSRAVPLNQGEE